MAVTTSDVLSEDTIRRVVEEEQEERLLWNQVFRQFPIPDNWESDTVEIPEDDGVMGQPERVAENSEYPREQEEYSKTAVTVQKYGFEVAFSWESQLYTIFDIVDQTLEKAARRMAEYINEQAFQEIEGNLHPNSPVEGSGTFDYDTLVDAKKELQDSLYEPDLLIVNTTAENDLLKSDQFQRASDLGDQTTVSGSIGRVAGLDVVVDNSGLLDISEGQGILVDSSEYGYEVVREEVGTSMYEAEERDADIAKLRTVREWAAFNPEAAVRVTAGN